MKFIDKQIFTYSTTSSIPSRSTSTNTWTWTCTTIRTGWCTDSYS